MLNLLWKEWHEQRWKFAFGCIVLGSFLLIGLRARIIADQTTVFSACMIGVMVLPLLAGTGLLPPERSSGSLESLCVLPIRPWQIMLAKTVIGMMLCIGPMLVCVAVTWGVCRGREMDGEDIAAIFGRALLAELALYFWYLAVTARLSGEARAGLVAVGLLGCWLILTGFLDGVTLDGQPGGTWTTPTRWRMLYGITPLASFFYLESQLQYGPPLWITAAVQLIIAGGLWTTLLPALRNTHRGDGE